MTGRMEEEALLAKVMSDPLTPGILVAGPPGVGKTRLVREAVAHAGEVHVDFVTATASARSLPFGAFAHLLPEDVGPADRIDLLAVIGRHLNRRAANQPAVLVVDDVHYLDEFSAALVHHVAVAHIATVLLTLRSGESAPDAIVALHRDGLVDRLNLSAISRADFDQLIQGALEGPAESLTLDQMWSVTQGNVLFAQELINDALGAGTLVQEYGVWHWNGGLGVATHLRESVAGRIGTLSAEQRTFLEMLAVGEPLGLSSVTRLAPTLDVPDLERRGLIVVEEAAEGPGVRLAHPIFGEALRAAMPVTLVRQINRTLAADLANEPGGTPANNLKMALLLEAAGEVSDPTLLTEGARIANILWDYRLGERLARAAVEAGGGFGGVLELGRALEGQNRFAASEAVLSPLIRTEPNDVERERLADTYSISVGYGLGRLGDALALLESVEGDAVDPTIRALLVCHRCTLLLFAARFDEVIELGMKAFASVEDDVVRVRSSVLVGISLAMTGRLDEALSGSEEIFPLALGLLDRDPRAPSWAASLHIIVLFFLGRLQEGQDFFEFVIGAVPDLPVQQVAAANAYRSRFALAQGRPKTALRLLTDVAVSLRDTPATVEPSWALSLAAEAHALLGQHAEARAAAEEAATLRRAELLSFHVDELRALAWVDAQDGRTSSAIAQLWTAADLARQRGQQAFELIILDDLLRLGEYGAAERARQVATQVHSGWSVAVDAHATATLTSEAEDWEAAAEAFAAIGANLVAAELWATASAARQGDGLPARAAEATRQSLARVALSEGAQTQPLSWSVAPVPLSRRERETAQLAAKGASNAEIAEALSVSIRTVESHLYAAFAKLGITQREQLSEVLPEA